MKIILTVISVIVGFIPMIFYFVLANLLSPDGFWQKLLVYGGGIWLLGGLQIIFLILLVSFLVIIWEK